MKFRDGQTGAALAVHVFPGKEADCILGVLEDGSIQVGLAAPNMDDGINSGLARYLSSVLGVREREIEILAGHDSEKKLISILGISSQEAQVRILGRLP